MKLLTSQSAEWTPKLLRSIANDERDKARENVKKNWLASAVWALATADVLEYVATQLESGELKQEFSAARLDSILSGERV